MLAVLSFPDQGYDLAGQALVPVQALGPVRSGKETQLERVILALRLPYLPDFIEDHTLVGQSDSERLLEIMERQGQFIANLWKWQNAAFSLRYLYDPDQAASQVAIVVRVCGRPRLGQSVAEHVAADVKRLAESFGLAVEDVASVDELRNLLCPIPTPAMVEVRQQERVVRFPWAQRDAYVVYPYWEPTGAFLQPCEVLLRQRSPCVVNLHIEPTVLSEREYEAIANAAAVAQTASDWQRTGYSIENTGRWADPQAALVARIYAALLHRLSHPFVMVAQVASSDIFAGISLAQTLGAAFTARVGSQGRNADLPSGFQVLVPKHDLEAAAASRTLHDLVLTPWGATEAEASPDLFRLRYLADARGAAALFRFPIAVHGGVPGIPVRQPKPDFEPGDRRRMVQLDEIHVGSFHRGGTVRMKARDLTRHGLIAGLPGSGKTNTCLYLLSQLHERHIPFLVIEPAKTEYRGLLQQPGFSDLLVFTLGDETTAPFRFNPFELLPGVRLEVHLEALNTAINAALPQFGVLPSIVEEALEECYMRHNWRLTDRGGDEPYRLFPTMADFYRTAIRVVQQRGYRGELNDNIQAAVKGRIGSLLRGSKGRMFNCRRSLPLSVLFDQPVILELDSLNDDVKALTMMFLLILVREYRQQAARSAGKPPEGLQHVLLIEEAHRIMENVASVSNPEISADTRARAVRAICDFLVEMRAYGQGVLIVEQSPGKLAPDAIRNTNLKIGHMLPGREDREALAAAMLMDQDQERFLGKLRVGDAAVFMTGFEKASFMTVPNYKDQSGFNDFLPDTSVCEHMGWFYHRSSDALLPFDGCRYCGAACRYREAVEPVTRHKLIAERFRDALLAFDKHPEPVHWPANWHGVAVVCAEAATLAGYKGHREAAYCYLAHEIDFPFTEHMRREFVRAVEAVQTTREARQISR